MAFLLSGEQPRAVATPFSPLRAVGAWLARLRARRTQRVALENLLEYDDGRLDDLGINRQDLFDAIQHPARRPGLVLSQRRAAAARNWLNP